MDSKEQAFGENFGQMITLVMLLMKCASQQCTKQTANAVINKDLAAKYAQFKVEQNKAIKLRLLGEINESQIMYELNTCVMKNCKKLVTDLVNKLKAFLHIVPTTSPKYDRMHSVINEIEKLVKTPTITEIKYNKHIKNINNILKTLD
jgi:hypothetical protein